ncbi:MAG: hypothetical protein GDA43_03500 [Hormoscilla sp. SP5CHS1]|nr:hypothetical protein [Hormoscilla sp. SP12CHS1]MBC6452370.1 hypothetical protein [Hormoscilla sp. SP5CHS1]
MFQLLYFILHALDPFLVPICFVCAWMLVLMVAWSLWGAVRSGVTIFRAAWAQMMHQIPCTGCQFFTNDYRLKCTVRPQIANTERAIACSDYSAKQNPFSL